MPENATEHINCHLNLKEKNKTLVIICQALYVSLSMFIYYLFSSVPLYESRTILISDETQPLNSYQAGLHTRK